MSTLHQSTTLTTRSGKVIDLSGQNLMCPICSSLEKSRTLYSFPPFYLVECSHCRTLHLTPLPSIDFLSEIYNNNYYQDKDQEHGYLDYAAEAGTIARTYRRRLKYVKPYLNKIRSPKILEIGSALGFGLPEARDLFGMNILACDVSQEAVASCQKLGFMAIQTDVYGICKDIDPSSLDMVYAFDVIEHLTNIPRFMSWLDTVLKPGGIFFLTTPDMNHIINKILGMRSPSIKIPQHIIYFTTETLKSSMGASFRCIDHQWDYQYVGFNMLISRLACIMRARPLRMNLSSTLLIPNGMRMYIFKKEEKNEQGEY